MERRLVEELCKQTIQQMRLSEPTARRIAAQRRMNSHERLVCRIPFARGRGETLYRSGIAFVYDVTAKHNVNDPSKITFATLETAFQ